LRYRYGLDFRKAADKNFINLKTRTTIGVIGLGGMGNGMAQSLRRAGNNMHVFDVRAESIAAFVKDGGGAYVSTSDLAAKSNVVVCVVVNGAQRVHPIGPLLPKTRYSP
jgi:phosphoglycerate dehydrogenase-like enzyme